MPFGQPVLDTITTQPSRTIRERMGEERESMSSLKVEVAALGSQNLTALQVSVDAKQR